MFARWNPFNPAHFPEWPTYYIDSSTCIDCGACVPECPFHAIYPEDEVPTTFKAKGGEFINEAGLTVTTKQRIITEKQLYWKPPEH